MLKEKLKEDRFISERELNEIINEKLSTLGISNINRKQDIDENENIIYPIPKQKHPLHKPEIPEHKKIIREIITFEQDLDILGYIFEDEFTADAVIKTLKESPLEIQIITKIILSLYERINNYYGE